MFTWNLQFVSKKRLAYTLNQLTIDKGEGRDVLVRIHTAIHTAEEAVDLAAFIKEILPKAKILGTSTSAILSEGKLIHDQCLISVTQMDEGSVAAARIPLTNGSEGRTVSAEALCAGVAGRMARENTRLVFAFFPEKYRDIERFVVLANEEMPGVQMIGGAVDWSDLIGGGGFVFDESGWSGEEAIFAALRGNALESFTGFATGVQVVGEEHQITKARGDRILEIDGTPAAAFLHAGIGEEICTKTEIGFYFPLAYSFDGIDVPFVFGYRGAEGIEVNHNVTAGRKIRRAFFCDRKIIADNRFLFGRAEAFEKGETLFSYACRDRFRFYPNSVKWELSAYQNSNMSGCLTRGEISTAGGRNVFTNCAFVLAAAGERPETQALNPYVFSHTESLAEDNQQLIAFLMEVAGGREDDRGMKESIRQFVDSCKRMLLYTEKENIANEAALHMDVRLGGYDRVCLIDVPGQRSMRTVFSEERIEKTHSHFIAECAAFAGRKNYRAYLLRPWQAAIAVPSYLVSLDAFTKDMRDLQKQLFETQGETIPVVSIFCILNECTADNLKNLYDAARLEMLQKNIQFHVCNGEEEELDAESIREKYRMVNVINYALAHDGVIPYYQGIYDNREKSIHHFESLMRLRDENGKIYTPFAFMEVARTYGLLYDALSMEMIRKVFDAFKDSEDKSVSINLGIRDIHNEELTRMIYGFLSTVRHPEHFIFEILENEDVDEYETLVRFVDNIHRLGGKTSIDDFGSGYSNLMHVVNIPSDFLKIDGSIVKECCSSQESESLIQLIASWSKINRRGARIVAEFVENEAIQDKLLRYNIDYSQGYLFSKPSPDFPDGGDTAEAETEK